MGHMKIKKPEVHFIIKNICGRKWMEDTLSTKNIFYDETDLTLLYFHVTNALKSGLSRSKKKNCLNDSP